MAIRYGDRYQQTLFPKSLEDSVDKQDPVRAFDAMIEALDLDEMGLYIDKKKVGNSSYNPVAMLKLLIYSYSYGWRSSRKIERATHHNISFIWLMGGLKPDHKTISNFRKKNKKVIKNVLKQTAKICLKLELIEGHTLFIDGTKMRGSCSISKSYDKQTLDRMLSNVDKNVEKLFEECKRIDNQESGSFIEMKKELHDKQLLQTKISDIVAEMNSKGLEKINITDHDAIKFKSRQGSHAGYNGHVVTDGKHGLIVSAEVVSESNDLNQFSQQIANATETLGSNCKVAVADAGYANMGNLIVTVDKGIDVIVPTQKQAAHNPKPLGKFDKDNFTYNEDKDCYICPKGYELKKKRFKKEKHVNEYKINDKKICIDCKEYGVCTTSKSGRAVTRHVDEKAKESLIKRYDSNEGKKIYSRRKEVAELPFGHIKRNLNAGYFLVRGIEAVNSEFAILTSCFNITRMIKLLGGVSSMVAKLQTI